ncbi:MAG: aminoglycoside phosphotransferase family protein [Planctomycetota bacterium]|nr:aminoglycoside phosphotransferase family protein [Planctomycetota bacterium]
MSRRDIYYWKCDRPAAFHGTQTRGAANTELESQLRESMQRELDARVVELSPGVGQGNHLTWNADVDGQAMFVRVENGPEKDAHLAIESVVLDRVREIGVTTPKVFGCDASRNRVPFAWQALERFSVPDLNHWFKQGGLDTSGIAFAIGQAVAKWQTITLEGFGTLEWSARNESQATLETHKELCGPLSGSRSSYADYFHLRLDEHLAFLVSSGFFTREQRDEIAAEIANHHALLDLPLGCLVHKDLALWNILGTREHIAAFIDFDDAISGDAMDDLSLLACFHDAAFLARAFEGYQSIRPLPDEHRRRFWLHLLRNMIVKAVIRVGAGYFDRDYGFFLIGSGGSGADLKRTTHARISLALRGLASNADLSIL